MIITEFNREQFAADAKQAILDRDITKLKTLKAMYGKRQVYLETYSDLQNYEHCKNDFVAIEPKLLEIIEMIYYHKCKSQDNPDWPAYLEAPFTPEEVREFNRKFEDEY